MLYPLTLPGAYVGWRTADSDLRKRGQYTGKDTAG